MQPLADANFILVGGQTPPDSVRLRWATTISYDWVKGLASIWEAIGSSQDGQTVDAPLAFMDINEAYFSPGRQAYARQVQARRPVKTREVKPSRQLIGLVCFLRVTLPLSVPGMVAGSMLVFVPAVGEFVIPDLLGGTDTLMIGKVVWDEFFSNTDWPVASAVAVALLVVLILPLLLAQRLQGDGR